MSGAGSIGNVPKFSSFIKGRDSTARAPAERTRHTPPGKHLEDEIACHKSDRNHDSALRKREQLGTELRGSSQVCLSKKDNTDVARSSRVRSRLSPYVPHHLDTPLDSSYFVDTRGDIANIQYGQTHKYGIPSHYRTGMGRILGVPQNLKIDKSSSNETCITLADLRRSKSKPRQLVSKNMLLSEPQSMLKRSGRKLSPGDEMAKPKDFIPLRCGKRRRRIHIDANSKSQEFKANRFSFGDAGISNLISGSSDTDMSSFSSSSSEDDITEIDQKVQKRNIELLRRTKSAPQDVQAWRDFAIHQEEMMRLGSSKENHQLKNAMGDSLADIKSSIFEDAIKVVGKSSEAAEELTLELLAIGERSWDRNIAELKWKKIIEEYPQSTRIWKKYADYIQGDFKGFSYPRCLESFRNCLAVMGSKEAIGGSPQNNNELSKTHVFVIVRMTAMIFDSGYMELAISIWQAFMELQMYNPTTENGEIITHEMLQKFELFWDSEFARFGEENSKGWSVSEPDLNDSTMPKNLNMTRSQEEEISLKQFSELEALNGVNCRQPARTLDESDDDFQVVLFTDIKPFLSSMKAGVSITLAMNGLLQFYGLPLLPSQDIMAQLPFRSDAFVFGRMFRKRNKTSKWLPNSALVFNQPNETFTQVLEDMEAVSTRDVQLDLDELIGNAFPLELENSTLTFIGNAMSQVLSRGSNDDAFCEYYLAFQYKYYGVKLAIKTAKKFLRKRPFAFRIYNVLLSIRLKDGDLGDATTIFTATQELYKSFQNTEDMVFIWRTWARFLVSEQRWTDARSFLLGLQQKISTGSALQPAEWSSDSLEAYTASQSFLNGRLNELIGLEKWDHIAPAAECIVLLEYLFHDAGLEHAFVVYARLDLLLERRGLHQSPTNELIHQRKANLIAEHIRNAQKFNIPAVRDELTKSVQTFPENTTILSVFAAYESLNRVDDRLRSRVREILSDDGLMSPSMWCFAIHYEIQRTVTLGATIHSIRAILERAVLSAKGCHSQLLWMLYVEFELEHLAGEEENQPNRPKEVFLRGLQHLPWSKDYMLLAFDRVGISLTLHEQIRILRVILEKEIRTFADVEAVLKAAQKR